MTVGLLIGILLGLAVGVAVAWWFLRRARHQDGAVAESSSTLGRLSDVQAHLALVTQRYDEAATRSARAGPTTPGCEAELTEARRSIRGADPGLGGRPRAPAWEPSPSCPPRRSRPTPSSSSPSPTRS